MTKQESTKDWPTRTLSSAVSEETKAIPGFDQFPFVTKLSFVPLINRWKTCTASPDLEKSTLARAIIKELDKQEYLEYIDHLIALNYIEKEVEDLLLEPAQGVQGLRALRIKVRPDETSDSLRKQKEEARAQPG